MPQIFPFQICRPFACPQLPRVGRAALFERRKVVVAAVVHDVVDVIEQVVVGVVDDAASFARAQLPNGAIPLARTKFPVKRVFCLSYAFAPVANLIKPLRS